MKKVLVIGGTGFTGKRVLDLLQTRDEVSILARKTSNISYPERLGFKIIIGDLNSKESLIKAMSGKDILINIASLGFGHADNIVSAAEEAGIERAVFVSTTALLTKLNVNTKGIRKKAEETIRASKLKWTILRPTMIFGGHDDRNIFRLVKFLKTFPIIPIPGDGSGVQQPIFVEDLAKAIVTVIDCDKTICKAYNLSGKDSLTYFEMVRTISTHFKLKRVFIKVPIHILKFIAYFLKKFSIPPRISPEQIDRIQEDKSFKHIEAKEDFNFNPLSFKDVIEKYPS